MIKYIKHKDVDKTKWDQCIARSSNGFIFAYAWYLEIVCENWDALIEGDYETVFPLPWKRVVVILLIWPRQAP